MPPFVESVQPLPIRNVTVVGAGTCGAAVAAHLANVGLKVTLLDVTAEKAEDGVARALQAKPSPFYAHDIARNVRCGGIAEHLSWLEDTDWVCEAVTEDAEVKAALYVALEPLLPRHAVISTCTAGLKVAGLAEGRSESFRNRFFGTHFAGSPRFHKLLEFTKPAAAESETAAAFARFLENKVGKRIIQTKDTAGFVASRLGLWNALHACHTAEKLRLPVELVDRITEELYGKSVFQVLDGLGLDAVAEHASLIASGCPDDPQVGVYRLPASFAILLERGCTGDKAGRGYYRSEGSDRLVFDLITRAYRDPQETPPVGLHGPGPEPFGRRVKEALNRRDEVGEFLRNHLVAALQHADRLKETIAANVVDIDNALKWTYGYPAGPFELIDAIGAGPLSIGGSPFYQIDTFRDFSGSYEPICEPDYYRSLADHRVVTRMEHVEVHDLGDDVEALSLIDPEGVLRHEAVDELTRWFTAHPDRKAVLWLSPKSAAPAYDLDYVLKCIEEGDFEAIEGALLQLQHLGSLLSQSRCVAAVSGFCVGAAFEAAASCPRLAAHPETVFGLPAIHAGLLPAGGGTAGQRLRHQAAGPRVIAEQAGNLLQGVTSSCAEDGRRKGFLRELDKVIYHPDRLLFEARQLALTVEPELQPTWIAEAGPLAGMIDRQKQELRVRNGFTAHDDFIGERIKMVFAKARTLEEAKSFERKAFVELCRKALTVARIRHLVLRGKPLKN